MSHPSFLQPSLDPGSVIEAETAGSFDLPEYAYFTPNADHIRELTNRTGYDITVTTGQRKYGGPPPPTVYDGGSRGKGECFIGSLNRDAFEPQLIPLLEEVEDATIYEVRLMMGYDGKELAHTYYIHSLLKNSLVTFVERPCECVPFIRMTRVARHCVIPAS